ncbi:MAG: helix-turn-helix transcriptional regulator [Chitinophagales bacterium]|jgi:DNA-binding transcriptional ArsR family regulator|nr:helix-turn-helix transcriptional regulator [Sphingobacteriales bacterium]MBP6664169.1 helix-turn-helix transcriptional regulator [Chitinophagales bacterium]MBP7533261.1 helix-turn-helix transcriptional regulator [Chitinophagales bacterium]
MAAFNHQELQTSSDLLRAIAHPLRMTILEFIDQKKVINVNKIYNTLKLEQSITSQHLRIMRNADLVEAKRDGKFIYYSLNYDKINHVNKSINSFVERSAAIELTESDFAGE